MSPKILLTGRTGIGKTTIIQAIVDGLGDKAGGFFTREEREGERRVGFEIVTLKGKTAQLARARPQTFPWAQPFGRYNVNLDAIERVAIPALREAWQNNQLVVIDEIGPMELLSERFHRIVLQIVGSTTAVLGTVMQNTHRLADEIKRHPAVTVVEVTLENRDRLPHDLTAQLAGLGDQVA